MDVLRDSAGHAIGMVYKVKLHGNLIAVIPEDANAGGVVVLTMAGWGTRTTASRLNAILSAFCSGGRVYRRSGSWHFADGHGWADGMQCIERVIRTDDVFTSRRWGA